MYPILLSVGPIDIYSLSVFLVLSWCVFSFPFWKKLRTQGVSEERIFDLMFYSTISAAVFSRIGFVLTHASLFTDNMLKIVALWVQPGLSFFSGLVFGILTLLYLSRAYKIRVGLVLDIVGVTLPWVIIVGKLGSLFDGSEVGLPAAFAWSVSYFNSEGLRHPVQLYEIIMLAILGIIMVFIERKAAQKKWSFGLVGIWFFFLYSFLSFVLEFFKQSTVYYLGISANQWILVAFFAEALGAFYVRGGGREKGRMLFRTMYDRISKRTS
ncbi:hypothetical protein A3A79_00675 [Candidatus Gottesmanbacteria bacterium RIFCSPLOWO2_01_FULL_43_11b]|uniref:Prolipoprotein diacylglyceryl transferase n=1 Tax=Candidatus Gottesmanbacteria bacterium RIFCSPLOWO2_01_FULL_43_11b TaxID=1798392 RepID=A0A1F6AG21_9BACT|nr:MAG: hypothetical protein A3A79_00675 [Candidatus Gottesmanbacteria bacterium RIFCSPLOWO2_01_FULL_43_11b]